MSNISFCQNVLQISMLQMRQNVSTSGKGLKYMGVIQVALQLKMFGVAILRVAARRMLR